MQNPFRPSAGANPPDLVGRANLLNDFEYGLDLGAGAPGLITIFSGTRGIGKTVMLGQAHEIARRHGWLVLTETATPGFMARIDAATATQLNELGAGPAPRRVIGATFAGFGVTTALPPERQVAWRENLEQLLNRLAEHRTGLILSVDEVHAADRTELAQLSAVVQHCIQADLPIGLVFAGLPSAISDLLNEGVATFLRRADKIDLHSASVNEVRDSLAATLAAGGIRVGEDDLMRASEATGGYPFLIQLVGYYLWREAETAHHSLDTPAVDRAIAAAESRYARTVVEAALATVSARDREYLAAMAVDDAYSLSADLTRRLGMTASAVANYRARMIDAGLIEPAGHGRVQFAVPGVREHLRVKG
ncbi:ATP-binding protein [Micrococcales bacterium 31B]|nr:ATP-binding protein [Micrococcales bacterium 31B]